MSLLHVVRRGNNCSHDGWRSPNSRGASGRTYTDNASRQASIRTQCGAKRLARGTHPKQGLHEVSASEDKMKVMAGDIYAGEIALVRAIQQVYAYDE